MGRDSVVGITTRYQLDGPRIESRWCQDFPYGYVPELRLVQSPVQWIPLNFWVYTGIALITHPS